MEATALLSGAPYAHSRLMDAQSYIPLTLELSKSIAEPLITHIGLEAFQSIVNKHCKCLSNGIPLSVRQFELNLVYEARVSLCEIEII